MRQEHLSFIDEVESQFEEDYMTSRLSIMKEQHLNGKPTPFQLAQFGGGSDKVSTNDDISPSYKSLEQPSSSKDYNNGLMETIAMKQNEESKENNQMYSDEIIDKTV